MSLINSSLDPYNHILSSIIAQVVDHLSRNVQEVIKHFEVKLTKSEQGISCLLPKPNLMSCYFLIY